MTPLHVLTWHVHGSYLYYLSQAPHRFYLPTRSGRPHPYGGRAGSFPWPDNVVEVPQEQVRDLDLDLVLFQSRQAYLVDQFELLTREQRRLPHLYLEHDPPRESPTDTRHVVDDPDMLLVHVTHFNDLMWDSGRTPTIVVRHGVMMPPAVRWTGELERGVVVVNDLRSRGRRLGLDVFEQVRQTGLPLDLVGMDSASLGGLGEVPLSELPAFLARYRFFFNPVRYTSLGLAVCEAMSVGLPIVGLATTEMVTAVEQGVSGLLDTDVDTLVRHMWRLLAHHDEARALSEGARARAATAFGIERFVRDWDDVLRAAADRSRGDQPGEGAVARAATPGQDVSR